MKLQEINVPLNVELYIHPDGTFKVAMRLVLHEPTGVSENETPTFHTTKDGHGINSYYHPSTTVFFMNTQHIILEVHISTLKSFLGTELPAC